MAVSKPRLRSLLILAIALIGTLVGMMISAGHQVPLPIRVLSGITRQKTTFYLAVRGGHAVAVKTSLDAQCDDGSTWGAKWSPAERHPVHFVANGNSFSTSESIKLTYTHGVSGTAQFRFQGHLTGVTQAQGTIRLHASFYVDHQWASCDSQSVPWAVGPNATARLSSATAET